MDAQELKQKYMNLYEYMAMSKKPKNMKVFGDVMTEMFDWIVVNKREAAEEWLMRLESIKWKHDLTPGEAEAIGSGMNPRAPWTRDQWRSAMTQHGFQLEKEPCYNRCALWATMSMIMSDSSATLMKYINNAELFKSVHDLAVDKLTDKDEMFDIRAYFGV